MDQKRPGSNYFPEHEPKIFHPSPFDTGHFYCCINGFHLRDRDPTIREVPEKVSDIISFCRGVVKPCMD